MPTPSRPAAVQKLQELLADWLSVKPEELELRPEMRRGDDHIDLLVRTPATNFLVKFKLSGTLPSVKRAIDQLTAYAYRYDEDCIPMVVVGYMTPSGRERCADAEISWADLSGNAHIRGPNLLVHVEGKPNQFKRRGRPSNLFSGKSARIPRHLLLHPNHWFLQRELAEATGLTEGYVSRIVGRLHEERLIERKTKGRSKPITVRDPDLLLDTWRENYRFDRHSVRKGIVSARSGERRLRKLSSGLDKLDVGYAATGLAAAWLWDGFVSFRLASVYLKAPLNDRLLDELGFRDETRGANVWLITPEDEGVFHGASQHKDVPCVHPIQTYLDLTGHPERAAEAADHLRESQIVWNTDD